MNIVKITLLILVFCLPAMAQKGSTKGPLAVYATTVERQAFADHIEALGTTRSNEMVMITADIAEKVTSIHFTEGQEVKKGDLLITLARAEENAGLKAAQAQLQEAQSSYSRAKELQKDKAISQATLQERLATLRQARAGVAGILARMDKLAIAAPFDGVLGLRDVSVGTLVQPGDEITTIDDISKIKVDFDVPSVYLPNLKEGLKIVGQVEAFGAREFIGTVQTVNTQVNPVTRMVKVRGIITNEDKLLKPGLLMVINVMKNNRQALVIPEETLVKKAKKNFVYKLKSVQGKMIANEVEVALGSRKAGDVEILSGLQQGDIIVAHGVVKVKSGMEVTVTATDKGNMPLSELLEQSQKSKEQQ